MLNDGVRFRHEYKYLEPEERLFPIEERLKAALHKDPHVSEKGFYSIRSVYFDDHHDSFLRENINGVDTREKWRIRIYDQSDSVITLERKRRKGDLIAKDSCRIGREECEDILKGRPFLKEGEPLLNSFFILSRTRLLRPRIIVEYERTPFVLKEGNVRVTFDRNIRSSLEIDGFFSDRPLCCRPVLQGNVNLMEVKYDGFLPDHVAHIIEDGYMRRTSFSKYALARKFTNNGILFSGFPVFKKAE